MSISIDNPLIFVYPKKVESVASTSIQSAHHSPYTSQSPNQLESTTSYNQLVQSSLLEIDSRSTVLSGSLILKFSKPKEIKKIIISLCGQSCIGFNDRPYEFQTILSKELELNLSDQLLNSKDQNSSNKVSYNSQHKTFILDQGHYRFQWSFILPPDLPPYERGQFGRTTHKVVAKIKLGSGLALGLKSIGKNLPSILFRVGNGGHEIQTESYFVAITYPSSHHDNINDNLTLNLNITDSSSHLGPYTLSATSCYFTVAGLLSFKFKLTDIPQRKKIIKIYKITCLIKQQYRLISMKDKDSRTGCPAESWPPCQRRRVFLLDYSNVPCIKSILPDGTLLNSSQSHPTSQGHHHLTSDLQTYHSSVDFIQQTNHSINTLQETHPSQPHEFLSTHSSSHNKINNHHHEITKPIHQSSHSCDHSSSIKSSLRRTKSSLLEAKFKLAQPGLYSDHSTEGIGTNLSQTNSAVIPQGNDPSTSTSQNDPSRSPNNNPNSDLAWNSQNHEQQSTSTPSHQVNRSVEESQINQVSVERPLSSGGSNNTCHLGPQQESPNTSSSSSHSTPKTRGIPKWRPGQRSNPHLSHVDPNIPLVTLTDAHKSWEIEHMGRLPTDDIIRPSTTPGTQTNIHIFHTLLFEITYSVEDDKSSESSQSGISEKKKRASITRKTLSIRKPVQISSCCCMAESMVLPPYSQSDPNADMVQHPTPSHAARMLKCVCDTPTSVLMKTQNPKNPQLTPNSNRTHENDDNSDDTSSVTHSILTFRSTNSSFEQPAEHDQHSQLIHNTPNASVNQLDNNFINIK